MVDVHWEGDPGEYFVSTLCLVANNRFDLVLDITTVLAGMRIVTHSINTRDSGDGRTNVYVSIDVHSIDHLDTIAKKLRKINGVNDVYRASLKK